LGNYIFIDLIVPIYRDIMLSRTKNEINESSKYRDVARERAEKEVRERKFYERRQLDTLMAKRDQLQRRMRKLTTEDPQMTMLKLTDKNLEWRIEQISSYLVT